MEVVKEGGIVEGKRERQTRETLRGKVRISRTKV